jgi:hypothetical protein
MLSLATHVSDEDGKQKDLTELTPMNPTIGVRVTRSNSKSLAVGKR